MNASKIYLGRQTEINPNKNMAVVKAKTRYTKLNEKMMVYIKI